MAPSQVFSIAFTAFSLSISFSLSESEHLFYWKAGSIHWGEPIFCLHTLWKNVIDVKMVNSWVIQCGTVRTQRTAINGESCRVDMTWICWMLKSHGRTFIPLHKRYEWGWWMFDRISTLSYMICIISWCVYGNGMRRDSRQRIMDSEKNTLYELLCCNGESLSSHAEYCS